MRLQGCGVWFDGHACVAEVPAESKRHVVEHDRGHGATAAMALPNEYPLRKAHMQQQRSGHGTKSLGGVIWCVARIHHVT